MAYGGTAKSSDLGGMTMAKIVFLPIMIAVFLSTTLALDLTGDWRAGTGE